MRILLAAVLLFARSIAAPVVAAGLTNKQQEVLSKQRQPYATDIDPLRDCDLPTCNWGSCAGALRYSMRNTPNSCIKSFHSLDERRLVNSLPTISSSVRAVC
jgi:hypothetical protein